MRRLPVAISLAAWQASALSGTIVHAAARTFVAFEYEVAPETNGCPDAAQFRASVERQLGYDPFRSAADKRVAVQIVRKEVGFDGHIRWSDPQGRWEGDRRLSSRRPECADIAASLAFSVVVQVQLLATLVPAPAPEPVASPSPPPPPQAVARALGASPTPPEPPTATAAPPPTEEPASGGGARRLGLSVGLGPSVALGMTPRPTALGRLFVSGRSGWVSVEIAADAALPATQDGVSGTGFSLDRIAAEAAVCGHLRAFASCLLTTVGRMEARGFGVDAPASPAGIFSQLGARVVATRDFGRRYFAAVRVDAAVMMSPWTVTLNEMAVWTTPRVGALFGLDLGAHFF